MPVLSGTRQRVSPTRRASWRDTFYPVPGLSGSDGADTAFYGPVLLGRTHDAEGDEQLALDPRLEERYSLQSPDRVSRGGGW